MAKGLLGRKLGMTQVFDENGNVLPVTVIKAGPCVIMQIKTVENDGYEALQIGFEDRKRGRVGKAQTGIAKKCRTEPKKFIREIRGAAGDLSEGDVIDLGALSDVRYVDVTGTSKGKGFAGVVKRWGFQGYPASHGAKVHRRGGSIGQASDPARVFKGMKMPGHMGNRKCTTKRLEVVRSDGERNLLFIKGSVPGSNGSYVIIKENEGSGE